jgi:hypothetical protein
VIQAIAFGILSKKFIALSSLALGVIALAVDPTAFAAAAVLVIGAIGGAAVLVINALGKMKTDILEKQALMDAKVDVVSGHVDGINTAAAAKRTADEGTITALRKQLSDSETRASMLAQSKATTDSAAAVPPKKK